MAAADPRRSRSERKLMSSTESAASIPAVELSGLGVTYGGPTGREVLRGIDLYIAPGEIVCIVGHSGIGKSTMIRYISTEARRLGKEGSSTCRHRWSQDH